MRRLALITCLFLLVAGAAAAATPYALDRDGTLWKATATSEGLLLTSVRDGQTLLTSLIPFPVDVLGTADGEIQVAVDELTGKVAVVWQRTFAPNLSDIMVALLNDGSWETIVNLSEDASANPRFPAIHLTQVSSTAADPADATVTSVIEDSFLHVVWWEGSASTQHGTYALLRLTAGPDDEGPAIHNVDHFLQLGLGCFVPAPQSVLEHPLFADQSARDRALLFHGSRKACLFQLVEISFKLEEPPPPQPEPGITVIGQRRRHTPVFGVRRLFSVPRQMALDNARIVLGDDLNPVAYRVREGSIEFVSATSSGWTPRRLLPVSDDLTMDRAIPLVERLAR